MEAYSKRMAVHVRRELREADGARFAQLLAYYKVRGGPGLGLALKEQESRLQHQQINYSPQASIHQLVSILIHSRPLHPVLWLSSPTPWISCLYSLASGADLECS